MFSLFFQIIEKSEGVSSKIRKYLFKFTIMARKNSSIILLDNANKKLILKKFHAFLKKGKREGKNFSLSLRRLRVCHRRTQALFPQIDSPK